MIKDGANGSLENVEFASENIIDLITTTLTGKIPEIVLSEFELDEATHEVIKYSLGNVPCKTNYYEKTGLYRASFNKRPVNTALQGTVWS